MAEFTIDIPNGQVSRLKEALKKTLQEGEAIDSENPTNEEIRLKAKQLTMSMLRQLTLNHEKNKTISDFVFEELGMS